VPVGIAHGISGKGGGEGLHGRSPGHISGTRQAGRLPGARAPSEIKRAGRPSHRNWCTRLARTLTTTPAARLREVRTRTPSRAATRAPLAVGPAPAPGHRGRSGLPKRSVIWLPQRSLVPDLLLEAKCKESRRIVIGEVKYTERGAASAEGRGLLDALA
jgi:hypothetical protein